MAENQLKAVNMGDKVELTARQLIYLLNDAMVILCLLTEDGRKVNTLELAKGHVRDLFERRKEQE